MGKKVIILLFFILGSLQSFSQCAMCKAVVESGDDGTGPARVGEQLNIGILFLMAIPYVFIVIIPIILFRKKIRQFFREMGSIYDDK